MSLLNGGEDIARMMQVTGEEGVSNDDYIIQQKANLVDMVYLQQDAFVQLMFQPTLRDNLKVTRFSSRSFSKS